MNLKTWVFPEHSGIIPGIPGIFPGGTKVVIDEDTNTIYSVSSLKPIAETSGTISISPETKEIVTPGYLSKKKAESSDSSVLE